MTGKASTNTKAKSTVKQYIITGKQCPIRVDMINGKIVEYKEGDKFKGSDWPMPHITIPEAIENGLIEEIEEGK